MRWRPTTAEAGSYWLAEVLAQQALTPRATKSGSGTAFTGILSGRLLRHAAFMRWPTTRFAPAWWSLEAQFLSRRKTVTPTMIEPGNGTGIRGGNISVPRAHIRESAMRWRTTRHAASPSCSAATTTLGATGHRATRARTSATPGNGTALRGPSERQPVPRPGPGTSWSTTVFVKSSCSLAGITVQPS